MAANGADLTEQDYLDVAAAAVAVARKAGAEEAEASVGAGNSFSATVRQGETEKLLESGSKGLSLRVFVGGRAASVSTSDFSRAAVRRAATDAVDLAKISDPDEHGGLPDAGFGLSAEPPALETYDPATAKLTPERLIEWAGRAEQAAFDAHARVTNSDGGTAERSTQRVSLVNSSGFAASYRRSSCGMVVEAIADDEDGKKRNGWWWTSHRSASQLESPEAVGRQAAERAVRQLGARQAPTGAVPVVWDITVGPSLLGIYARAADGHAAYRGSTFLLGREGETIGSASAVVVDDPTRPGLPSSRPFDAEGLPTQRNVLFDAGRFTDFLMDTYSSRKLGKASTHSAGRGSARTSVTTTNFYLESGNHAPEEIIASVDNGLFLTDLIGFAENITTGDFSRGAGGVWIEGGQLTYPVSEITVSGHLGEMLSNLDMVGNDLQFRSGTAAPTFRIGTMMVSGQ
ncbi:MAG: hypothetical protein CL878_14935 [Dehalococcoidia bacterium]|nr:hypothetical protein [Dehalococcoidia bacterium]